jgi:DNA-binding transcriptional ArsR family regulator
MVNLLESRLDRAFAALSEPSRRAMLLRLEREQDLTVSELARDLPIKLPTVLKHLKMLSEAGLVRREKQGRTVRISLTPEPLRAAAAWLDRYEHFWTSSLDRLAAAAEAHEEASAEGREAARSPQET